MGVCVWRELEVDVWGFFCSLSFVAQVQGLWFPLGKQCEGGEALSRKAAVPGALRHICAHLSSCGAVSVHLDDVVQSSEPGVGGTQCAVVVPLVTEEKPCCFQHDLTGSVEPVMEDFQP